MRYINKAVFIEAVQFTGSNIEEINEFIECSNVISATILNNVLYLIVQTHDKAEVQRWNIMPNEYLIKDASGYISSLNEEVMQTGWIPFNYSK
jgi:hypothetical protein